MSLPDGFAPRQAETGAPVFAEAWHAEALAIAFALSKAGLFTAAEWSEALGAALRAHDRHEGDEAPGHYYEAVLAALETLIAARSPATGAALDPRVEAWRRAYLRTPHGKPVELAAGKI